MDQSPKFVGVARGRRRQTQFLGNRLATMVQTLVRLASQHRWHSDLASQGAPRSRERIVNIRDFSMTAEQADLLRRECNITGPQEGACQIICGTNIIADDPWQPTGDTELRLTMHRVEPIHPDLMRKTPTFVSWDMDCYVRLLRKARDENLHPGICHSHPNSSATFSRQDDENERHLRDILQRRNQDQMLVSVLFHGDGKIDTRVWYGTNEAQITNVRILGATVDEPRASPIRSNSSANSAFLHRQSLSISQETVEKLHELRVAVVGCGGTGSAVAVLLARAGIGRLLLIDPDIVSETNLNRLHGSTRRDVEMRRPKVQTLKDHIERMGLGTQVAVLENPLVDATTGRSLCSCDCVFGCTDDHLGRLILNRVAYLYYVPVIDTCLSVDPRTDDRPTHISGRVTVLRPGVACLLCRGVINPRRAREQGLRHKRPDEYTRQLKEGYITDSDTPTPVVGTFTTETATAAVNEFLAGFANLRGDKGWTAERTIRYDLDRCRPTGCTPRLGCRVCAEKELWGLGDVQPFLDLGSL